MRRASLGLSLLILRCWAQPAAAPLAVGPAYSGRFPVVEIVLDPTQPPPGQSETVIRQEDLLLLEDGAEGHKANRISYFHETGEGLAVVLAIDASGSMRGRPMQAVREGLSGFVSKARQYDRISVLSIADDTRWETTWTTPPAELKQKLEAMTTRGRLTRLWDALDEALTKLEAADLPSRKRLVVISDGQDEGSLTTLAQVVAHARRLRIP